MKATLTLVLVAALALSACGQATGGGSGGGGSSPAPATQSVTGTVVQSDTEHAQGGTLLPGVKVGLYLHAVHAGGPIAADPPQPIATVTTDGQGHFRFAGLHPGKRYSTGRRPATP
jgi:hypothetical protein